MNYLITGGHGWIAGYLAYALRGQEVFLESRALPPPTGQFDRVIHCSRGRLKPYMRYLKSDGKVLLCSSGAVKHKPELEYAQGKTEDEDVQGVKIARIYSVIGYDTPLSFAVGEWIFKARRQQPIVVQTSGRSVRSYIWMDDLVTWLLAILENGREDFPYEVGSIEPIMLLDLAYNIGSKAGVQVQVLDGAESGKYHAPEHYVPDTGITRRTLNLSITTSLDEAITKALL